MTIRNRLCDGVRLVAFVIIAALLAACSRTESSGAGDQMSTPESTTDGIESTTTTEAKKQGGSSQGVEWELPRTTQYGTLLVTVESAQRLDTLNEDGADTDEETDNLVVNLGLENLAQNVDWTFPSDVFHLETADGTRYEAWQGPSEEDPSVQMGSTSTGDIMFEVPSDTDLSGASLSVYESDMEPAVIALDGEYDWEPRDPVSVSLSPSSLDDGGNPEYYCAGNADMRGVSTNDWGIELTGLASQDALLAPEAIPNGAGNFIPAAGSGSYSRAMEDHVILTIRASVSDNDPETGSCNPDIRVLADGQEVETNEHNLYLDEYGVAVSHGTEVGDFTFQVPVDTEQLSFLLVNPSAGEHPIDTAFLVEFQE